jgi:hypothetical protein
MSIITRPIAAVAHPAGIADQRPAGGAPSRSAEGDGS